MTAVCSKCGGAIMRRDGLDSRGRQRWWHVDSDGRLGFCTAEEYERQVVIGCFNVAVPA